MNKPLHNILSTFIILWFLTIPVTSVSQDISQQIDSLKSLLPLSTNTSNSCKLYIELSKLHLGVNNELGIAYADSSLQIALDNDMYAMAFSALNSKSNILYTQRKDEAALVALDKVQTLIDEHLLTSLKDNPEILAEYIQFLVMKERVLFYTGEYYNCFIFGKKAYDDCISYGLNIEAAKFLERTGGLLAELGDYELGLEYQQRAIAELKKSNNTRALGDAYQNVSENFINQKKYTEALEYIDKAIEIVPVEDDWLYEHLYYGKAECNYKLGRINEAENSFIKSYTISLDYGKDLEAAYCQAYLAQIRLSRGDTTNVENDLIDSYIIGKEEGYEDLQLLACKGLDQFYQEFGNYSKAHEQATIILALQESITNNELLLELRSIDLEKRFAVDKKEALLKSEIVSASKINKLLIGLVSLFAFGACLLFYVYKNTLRIKKQLQINNAALLKTEGRLTKSNTDLQSYIKLNKELEQFAYIASHDIKAPLRTIVSYSGLLRRKFYEAAGDSEKMFFDFIQKSIKNLNLLIDDLLNYAQSNNQLLSTEKLSLKDTVNEVLQNLHFSITKSNANVIVENCDRYIIADYIKLKQILQNIISNALKFISEDRSPVIIISSREEREHLYISIKDNGIGIAKEDAKHVFEKFTRLNTQDEFEGSGLGLSICAKYVKNHNGTIAIESNDDYGVTFIFSLDKNLPLTESLLT